MTCPNKWLTSRNCGVRLGVRLRSLPALTFLGICDSHPKHQTSSILWTSPRACWIEGILERTQFNPFTLQIRKQVPRQGVCVGRIFQVYTVGQVPDLIAHNAQAWVLSFRVPHPMSLDSSGVGAAPFHHVSSKILLPGVASPAMILSCHSE